MNDIPSLDEAFKAAEAGESFSISREGKPVVVIMPYAAYKRALAYERALCQIEDAINQLDRDEAS